MIARIFIYLLISVCIWSAQAQEVAYNQIEMSINPSIKGSLMMPSDNGASPLVILIAGSGPTDRNGNQNMMKNNSLRFLAEGLYQNGISTFRYDKRIVLQLQNRTLNEEQIRFDDFIEDAIAVVDHFKDDERFSAIYVAGHSQGSLVGMVAAQNRANGFISIAGAGQEIDDVIVDQLQKQAPGLVDNARQSFDDLRVNGVAQNYSPGLASIFRPAIQPFILTWMQYDPKAEITKLNIPVLIINGGKDLQVQESEAQALHEAKPDAQLVIIPKMNHIFKEIEGDDLENSKSYNEYNRPVIPELIETVAAFVKK